MKRTNQNGITLIALIVTIVLNCYRSGRKKMKTIPKIKTLEKI